MKFKIGQDVKIIKNIHHHEFEIGSTVKITGLSGEGYEAEANGLSWYVEESELSPINKTIRDVEIGDEILDFEGDKMTVTDIGEYGFAYYWIDNCNYIPFDEAEEEGWKTKEKDKTPEYTMKEAIEKMGHDFKIKK